jgi:hypothetical protein
MKSRKFSKNGDNIKEVASSSNNSNHSQSMKNTNGDNNNDYSQNNKKKAATTTTLRRSPRRNANNNDSDRPKRKRKSTEKAAILRREQEREKLKKSKDTTLSRPTVTQSKRKKKKSDSSNKNGSKHHDYLDDETDYQRKNQQRRNGIFRISNTTAVMTNEESKANDTDDDIASTTSSLDEKDIVCCICHCSVDFSERDVFLPDMKDKKPDDDDDDDDSNNSTCSSEQNDDVEKEEGGSCSMNEKQNKNEDGNGDDDESSVPYCGVTFPKELYDPNNALIICDKPGCNRSYHQRCHFVPIFCLPRGNWYCLICQYKDKLLNENISKKKNKKKTSRKGGVDEDLDEDICALSKPLTIDEIDSLYPIPKEDYVQLENNENENGEIKQVVSIRDRFEFQTASLKASMLHTELRRRIKSTIDSAIGALRLEEHTIRGYTETERAKKSLMDNFEMSKRLPQQLVQSVDRMAHNKMRIRALMLSVDSVIRNRNDRNLLHDWYLSRKSECKNTDESSHVDDNVDWHLLKTKLFRGDITRKEPRFELGDYDGDVESDDDDEEDPTNKIKCTVCFSGKVQPDNDVIMCDGENCFRAFHMKCCNPVVTQRMLDEDEQGTWFCPYCFTLANAIHYTQSEYYGDEVDGEDDSISSWDNATDVFPEAAAELESAKLWKRGRRNETSDKYLNSLLGIEIPCVDEKGNSDESNDDDESDHNYSMADEEDNGSLSDSCSEGSDGNDVPLKWKVDKDEIEALSQLSSQDSGSDDNEDSVRKLRSRNRTGSKEKKSTDIGKIDVDNIMYGKRNRTKVDYKR